MRSVQLVLTKWGFSVPFRARVGVCERSASRLPKTLDVKRQIGLPMT